MHRARAYYIQRPRYGWSCALYALVNACRHLGMRAPRPGGREWNALVELGGCQHGACIDIFAMARRLGLQRKRVDYRQVARHTPCSYNLYSPDGWFHVALVIGGSRTELTMVNYAFGDDVKQAVMTVPRSEIRLPPRHLRRCYRLRPDSGK